jgi:hypothetical protein
MYYSYLKRSRVTLTPACACIAKRVQQRYAATLTRAPDVAVEEAGLSPDIAAAALALHAALEPLRSSLASAVFVELTEAVMQGVTRVVTDELLSPGCVSAPSFFFPPFDACCRE